VTSTLDGDGQCALMVSAGAGHTAGNDLSTLRDVLTQTGHVLVIDGVDAIDTEAANLLGRAGREPSVLSKAIAYYLLLDF
jgi:hypothetical protein